MVYHGLHHLKNVDFDGLPSKKYIKNLDFDLPGLRFPEGKLLSTRPQDGTAAPGAPGFADSEASGLSAEVAALVKAAKAKEWRPEAVQAGLVQLGLEKFQGFQGRNFGRIFQVQLGFQGFQLGGISVGFSRSNDASSRDFKDFREQ